MKTDVLIVGGGLTGCALSYFLAKAGVKSLLVERFDLNTQASGSNAGSIHAQIEYGLFKEDEAKCKRVAAILVPLLRKAIALWEKTQGEFDEDFEFDILGGLLVADRPNQMRIIERKAAVERSLGLSVDVLSTGDLRSVAPYVSDMMIGGALCATEGQANALVVTTAFARATASLGATIMTQTQLVGIERNGSGFTAETDKGRIAAERVVNCAGAAGGEVARLVGIELPIFGDPIQVSVTEPVAPLVRHLVYCAGAHLTLKQSRRGALIIGGGWPARRDEAGRLGLKSESVRGNLRVCQDVVPKSGSIRVIRTWPAVVNDTADTLPIMGEVASIPGYYVASFPRMGFTGGPITGRIVADMLLGNDQELDIAPLSPNRFR